VPGDAAPPPPSVPAHPVSPAPGKDAKVGPPDAETGAPEVGADALGADLATNDPFIADPGPPARLFGPKCGGHFGFVENGLFAQNFAIDNCTAYSHSGEAGSQIYLHFGTLPAGVASAYASVLLPLPRWRPGLYSRALAGRIEVVLKDGRRYRTFIGAVPGGTGDLPEITLRVDQTSENAGEPSHYIKGAFDAQLAHVAGGDGPPHLFMQIEIDAPAAAAPEPILQLDCRPGLPGAVDVRTRCQLTRSNGQQEAYCQQLGGMGGFGVRVVDAGRVVRGVVPLGGPAPALRLFGQFTTRNTKPLLVEGSETGYFEVFEMVPDKVLRGRFLSATVTLGPVGAPTCRIGETVFEATVGG
jgi:hypothetical protein